jgi:tetratricopeptide (TPR) repeat protein
MAALVLAVMLLVGRVRSARAQENPREAARWHYARGLKLAGENGYEAALQEFTRAYDLSPQFAVLYNIGQCQVALGRPTEAIDALSLYLRQGEDHVPPDRRLLVEQQIAELRSRLSAPAPGRDRAVDPREAAREHYLHGLELAGRNAYRGALRELTQAYEISPEPAVLFNIGQCHVALGEVVEGIEALSRYLREGQERVPAGRRDLVEVQIALLESRLAELTVVVDRPEVVVTIDGREVGRTPLAEPIRLAAGAHAVSVALDGMLPTTQTVTLGEVERKTLAIKLPRPVPRVAGPAAAAAAAVRAATAAEIARGSAGAGRGRAGATSIPADDRN